MTTLLEQPAPILTPKPAAKPRLTGPKVFGVRPGAPFLFTVTATGHRPMLFSANGLPAGLRLDPNTGQITGSLPKPGTHLCTLTASNPLGTTHRPFKIVVGDTISLTPPLGWNSWNCWGPKIDQEKILDAASAMVRTGLIHHGWSYVNIDDGWQGERDPATGVLQPNEKFPNLKGLCDAIHAMGLRVGIYSTPWVKSFAGYAGGSSGQPGGPVRDVEKGWYVGQHQHEPADALQWAKWGIDFLKYDWGPMDLDSGRRMRLALDACGRDILFNATNSAPKEHEQAWSDLTEAYFIWRRPAQGDNDIKDSWKSVSSIGFRMHEWRAFARPGHWNDPDMLVVGHVGWGDDLHPANLTPDEQYTHLSLWSLLAAPLLLGCDLTRLDEFTLSLLTNDEVLDVNQDPLGHMADRVNVDGDAEVWAKHLEDGSLAVGLFNRGETERPVTFRFRDLGLTGSFAARDLWRQRDLGAFGTDFVSTVAPHGVTLVRIRRT